jgi:hypothetical protein
LKPLLLLGLRAFVQNLISREISSDFKIQITIFKTNFLFFGLKGKKKFNAEKKRIEAFKREKKQVRFFFQPGRGRFNIFVTLADYCGGYSRATERGHFSFESFGVEVYIFLSAFRNFSYLCHGLGMRSVH